MTQLTKDFSLFREQRKVSFTTFKFLGSRRTSLEPPLIRNYDPDLAPRWAPLIPSRGIQLFVGARGTANLEFCYFNCLSFSCPKVLIMRKCFCFQDNQKSSLQGVLPAEFSALLSIFSFFLFLHCTESQARNYLQFSCPCLLFKELLTKFLWLLATS